MKVNIIKTVSAAVTICCFCLSQQRYFSPEDVKAEWKDYTSFQRSELVNFATFLYNEGFYERALISYFQYLYRYPKDELEMATYFQIAKCYENMENSDLATSYYQRIIDESPKGSNANNAAKYQLHYLSLLSGDMKSVIDNTSGTTDPYEMIFRAYAHFESLEWDNARKAFKAAEARFDHSHYTKQIRPWYNAISIAENAPLKEKTPALLSSLAPGGGFIYLNQTENAVGAMGASFLIYAAMISSSTVTQKGGLTLVGNRQQLVPMADEITSINNTFQSSSGYAIPSSLSLESKRNIVWVPPALLAVGLYVGSMWKSVNDIDESNRKLVKRYAGRVTKKLPIQNFMDYETPDFVLK